MPIAVTPDANVSVLTLSGRFDALTAKEFKNRMAELLDAGRGKVVLDMAAVDFIDSSGLGALVGSLKSVTKEHGEIRIAGLSPQVRTIFELTRLHRIFDIYPTVEAARDGL